MDNSSDIFCLKAPRCGENDGTLIFSVKGTSSDKIHRRRQNPTSDVFQFGLGRPNTFEIETPVSDNENVSKTAHIDLMNDNACDEATASPSSIKSNPLTGDDLEITSEGPEPPERNEIETEISLHESAEDLMEKACTSSTVSSSNMRRNPVTGYGLEADKHDTKKCNYKKRGTRLW